MKKGKMGEEVRFKRMVDFNRDGSILEAERTEGGSGVDEMNQDKIGHWLKLTRWREYYGTVVIITLLGIFLVRPVSLRPTLLLLGANFLSCVFIFMINDIEDAEDDALDKNKRRRNPISAGEIEQSLAYPVTFLVGLVSLGLYFSLGLTIFWIGLSGMVLGFLYSFKKVRLKSRPIIDLLSHGYFVGGAYFVSALPLGELKASGAVLVGLFFSVFVISVLGDLRCELRDYEVDRKAGINNTLSVVNLLGFKKYIFYIIGLINLGVFFYLLFQFSAITKVFLVILGGGAAYYFFFIVYRRTFKLSKHTQYPYQQELFTLVGFLLWLNSL